MPGRRPRTKAEVTRVNSQTRLPVISLAADALLEATLLTACINEGFFYLADHTIPPELVKGISDLASAYFLEAPESEKLPGNGDTGYTVA